MSFRDTFIAARRLQILRLLNDEAGYSTNAHLLSLALGALGHRVGRKTVIEDLEFLSSAGLVTTETIEQYVIATITLAGADVATGRERVEGVAKPRPGA